mgnify:CR=1 FL=1
MYVVIACPNCGRLLLARTGQKTRRCPGCGARLILENARKLAYAETAREATRIIQALKMERARKFRGGSYPGCRRSP